MINYCKEVLYHFSCGLCKKWFSIGDYDPDEKFGNKLHCPHCGELQDVEEIKEM